MLFKPKSRWEVFIILLKLLPSDIKQNIIRLWWKMFGITYIYTEGNVGWGPINPSHRLHVVGNITDQDPEHRLHLNGICECDINPPGYGELDHPGAIQ